MRRLTSWWLALLVWPAFHCQAGTTTLAEPDCTAIASAVNRLACFDARNGTPANTQDGPALSTQDSGLGTQTTAIPALGMEDLVRRNETKRKSTENGFLLERTDNNLVISAPAIGEETPKPYLAIGCLANISHLQLLAGQNIPRNQVFIQLSLDGKALSPGHRWQVLDAGDIADAGRGLIAIELLRRLDSGGRLRLESDFRPFDGMEFDARGLKQLIAQQREACHW